jgi:hypothetical protein
MNSATVIPTTSGSGREVVDDAPNLGRGQPSWPGAQIQHDLVAVDAVDVEVDRGGEHRVALLQLRPVFLLQRRGDLSEPGDVQPEPQQGDRAPLGPRGRRQPLTRLPRRDLSLHLW